MILQAMALAAALLASPQGGIKDTIKERAAEAVTEAVIPSRGAPAAWCSRTGCKTGVSGSLVRQKSKLFPRRYWTLDLFLGDGEGGAAIAWETFPHQEGNLRLFLGLGFALELRSEAIEAAQATPIFYASVRF